MEFENLPESELDKRLAVKFYKKAVLNKFKSKQEGRQVYDDVDYISILIPGDNTTKIDKKVTDEEKRRFSIIWEKYQNNQASIQNGLSLSLLPGISPAQVENLKGYNIHTIEQLAGLGEKAIQKIMNARELIKDAQKFLEGSKYTVTLEEKLKAQEERIRELEELLRSKKDEPSNNNTECDGRDGAGGDTNNDNRKQRQVRKKVSGTAEQGGERVNIPA